MVGMDRLDDKERRKKRRQLREEKDLPRRKSFFQDFEHWYEVKDIED